MTNLVEKNKAFPLTPTEYEDLVGNILNSFSKITGLQKVGCGLSNLIEGWSGIKHQIDVTFRQSGTNRLLLIECKQWTYPIELRNVLEFHSRIRDIGKNQNEEPLGFMATTKGYQSGAGTYAVKYEIQLNTVKDVAEYSIVFAKRLGVVQVFLGERQGVS